MVSKYIRTTQFSKASLKKDRSTGGDAGFRLKEKFTRDPFHTTACMEQVYSNGLIKDFTTGHF